MYSPIVYFDINLKFFLYQSILIIMPNFFKIKL